LAYRRTERVMQRLAARRDAIVAAAQLIAAESGMAAVQIVPVAAKAGIAAGTVYRYFPAKSDLVAALMNAVSERELAAIRRAADAAPGPLSALAAALTTFAARVHSNRTLARAVFAEPIEGDVEAVRLACRRALAGEFERRVRAATEGGHLPEQQAGPAAVALTGALIEGLIGPLSPDTADDAGKARGTVQTLTLLSLRALGVVDARARGLVVQTAMPKREDAA
jgi:AcrR family transcriptional regulator